MNFWGVLWGIGAGVFFAGGWLSLIGFCAISGCVVASWRLFWVRVLMKEELPIFVAFVIEILTILIPGLVTRLITLAVS